MEKMTHNRRKIRLILYAVVLVSVLSLSTILSYAKSEKLTRQLNVSAQRSLSQLEAYVGAINTDLQKGMYANTTGMLEEVSNELTRDASGAKNALSALPVSDTKLDNTYKFLSQVAAFVGSLNKKLANGETLTDSDREQLASLYRISSGLKNDISTIMSEVENGEVSFSKVSGTIQSSDENLQSLSTALTDAEQAIGDYPTLIYDGPFSDNIMEKRSEMLENVSEISKDDALKKAAEFMETDPNTLKSQDEMTGKIDAYIFSNDSSTVAITRKGGYVLYLLGSSFVGEEKLSQEQAVENAKQFLNKKGYPNMEQSYYSTTDGVCTVNFAYRVNDITCYPDLIKVSISLETGNIINFDASGYIMNHRNRELSTPMNTIEQAQQSISPLLTVMSSGRAIIPTKAENEKDCYEFHCKNGNDEEFLIYVNTATLQEEEILILLYADGGILTK